MTDRLPTAAAPRRDAPGGPGAAAFDDDRAWAVVAEGLTKRFGDFVAVDDITFRVPRGDIFGFLGPNGAGKTTTIRMLLGLLAPSGGRARVVGLDAAHQASALQSRVGYVSQRFSLYRDLTVRENLRFYGQVYGVTGARLRERLAYGLEMTGLTERGNDLAGELAGGYRQRLALACAILHEPEALFLDEPTAGVDPISRRRFWDFLHDLAERGHTLFVTTHYMDEAENCRHLVLIDDGRIVLDGAPHELKSAMAPRVVEMDCDQPDAALSLLSGARMDGRLAAHEIALYGSLIHAVADDAAALRADAARLLAAAGVAVRSLDVIAPSLEDVFIHSVRGRRTAAPEPPAAGHYAPTIQPAGPSGPRGGGS